MVKTELWGYFPGGRQATIGNGKKLEEVLDQLIAEFGPEAVAQVAVLRTGIMPVMERNPDR
jgi:hypothetical protein